MWWATAILLAIFIIVYWLEPRRFVNVYVFGIVVALYMVVGDAVGVESYNVNARISYRFLTGYYVWWHIHRKAAASLYHHISANMAELMAQHFS